MTPPWACLNSCPYVPEQDPLPGNRRQIFGHSCEQSQEGAWGSPACGVHSLRGQKHGSEAALATDRPLRPCRPRGQLQPLLPLTAWFRGVMHGQDHLLGSHLYLLSWRWVESISLIPSTQLPVSWGDQVSFPTREEKKDA